MRRTRARYSAATLSAFERWLVGGGSHSEIAAGFPGGCDSDEWCDGLCAAYLRRVIASQRLTQAERFGLALQVANMVTSRAES